MRYVFNIKNVGHLYYKLYVDWYENRGWNLADTFTFCSDDGRDELFSLRHDKSNEENLLLHRDLFCTLVLEDKPLEDYL